MERPARALDPLVLQLLRLLPKHLISRLTGLVARCPLPPPLNVLVIRTFARAYGVNLDEAEHPPAAYPSFHAFFVRRLRSDARPLDPDPSHLLSPVDGTVTAAGEVADGLLFQAKGRTYALDELLADPAEARRFRGGGSCTLYLSPADYHRIHMPLDGRVICLRYVPGRLFPVNAFSLDRVPDLLARNERLILHLETDHGRVGLVMIGATNVGKIRLLFDDVRTHLLGQGPFRRDYRPPVELGRGREVGCFELGSTVILLLEPGRVAWDVRPGDIVRVGRPLGFLS